MSPKPREVLIEIIAKHGDSFLASPGRCEGALKDYCGEFRREIFVLVSCLRAGVVEQLRQQNGASVKLTCSRQVLKLEQNLAISGDIARWAVESWAIALGLLDPLAATAALPNPAPAFVPPLSEPPAVVAPGVGTPAPKPVRTA